MEKSSRKGRKGVARARPKRQRREDPGVRIGRRNVILFLAGLGAIVLGFLTLAFGSTALPAIFLVGGYLVLVPWAILSRGDNQDESTERQG